MKKKPSGSLLFPYHVFIPYAFWFIAILLLLVLSSLPLSASTTLQISTELQKSPLTRGSKGVVQNIFLLVQDCSLNQNVSVQSPRPIQHRNTM